MIDANEQYEKEYSHLVAQREQRAREISRRESEICAELIERSQTLLGAISLVEELDNPELVLAMLILNKYPAHTVLRVMAEKKANAELPRG